MSTKLDAEASELDRDLNADVCSARLEDRPSAPVIDLKTEL